MEKNFGNFTPLVDAKELAALDTLTSRYDKLISPSVLAKLGEKAGEMLPQWIKEFGSSISQNISEADLYNQIMNLLGSGFKVIEEQAARFSISEKSILAQINKYSPNCSIDSLDEICLARSYNVAKAVNSYKSKDILAAVVEGGSTGYAGLWGLPANILLSTFLYFRAVQSIAMFYGYDVKNDSTELVIASQVFTNALSPANDDINNEATAIIGKFMLMGQAAAVQQAAKKGWAEMASRGGIPLLLTQLRALANKAAQKALQKAGEKGLENSLFKEAFEQIGKRLTLKSIGKSVPVASAIVSALLDTAQMNKVLEYADIFYQKRFIFEKENRMRILFGEDDVVDVDFTETKEPV